MDAENVRQAEFLLVLLPKTVYGRAFARGAAFISQQSTFQGEEHGKQN